MSDSIKILCLDNDGYKCFNQQLNKWILLSTEITVDMFDKYGVESMTTDDGLFDEYDVLIHDTNNDVSTASFEVVPTEQKISINIVNTDIDVFRAVPDFDYDSSVCSDRTEITKTDNGLVNIDIYINKTDVTTKNTKLYCVRLYDK
jgi:hypothetical protein